MRRALIALWLAFFALPAQAQEATATEPGYAYDAAALSIGLSAGTYALAGLAGVAFLGINQQCDDAGQLGSLFCDTAVLPFVGIAGAAALGGAALAPSVAHVREGDVRHARITTSIRLAGAASVALGVREIGRDGGQVEGATPILLAGGGAALLGLGVYDMVDAGFARGRVQARKAKVQVRVAPAPVAAPGGQTGLGLSFTGNF